MTTPLKIESRLLLPSSRIEEIDFEKQPNSPKFPVNSTMKKD